jgi:hypothetical protein
MGGGRRIMREEKGDKIREKETTELMIKIRIIRNWK